MAQVFSGKRLADLRKAAGLTQAQLGKKVGATRQAIASYESGYRTPSLHIAIKLAEALKVTVDYLIRDTA